VSQYTTTLTDTDFLTEECDLTSTASIARKKIENRLNLVTDPRWRTITDFDEEEPLAAWEAAFLPDWTWEAYDKKEDDLYFGRVKSPNTYDQWEYGYFSQDQREQAGAYRIDLDPDSDNPLFPDGGTPVEDVVGVYETELEALLETGGDEQYKR